MSINKQEQERKERDARSLHAKNQQAQLNAAEEARKREMAVKMQQQQHAQQTHRENIERQMQLQMSQNLAQRNVNNMNAMSNGQHMVSQGGVAVHAHPATSGVQNQSPIVRQQTPMASSPMGDGMGMSSVQITSTPMATSLSNQGVGSPATRPQTANLQHPNGMPMARQISQQQHVQRPGSAMGTPQVQNTPHMTNAGPVRHMTPQPRMAGSPVPGQLQAPAMMMTQSQQQQLTPEQHAMLRRRQMQQMGQMTPQMNAQAIQGMAGLTQQQQMNMLQMQQRQLQMQQQQQQQNPIMQQQQQNNGMNAASIAARTIGPVLSTFEGRFKTMLQRFMTQFPQLTQVAQEQEKARIIATDVFKRESEQRRLQFIQGRTTETGIDWMSFYATEARFCNGAMSTLLQKSQQLLQAHANSFRQRQLQQQALQQAQLQNQQGIPQQAQQQAQQQMQQLMNNGMNNGMTQAQMMQAMAQAQNQGGNPMANNATRQYVMQLQQQKMMMQRGMMNQMQQQGIQGMGQMNGMNPQMGMNQMQGMPNNHQLQQLQQQQLLMNMQHNLGQNNMHNGQM